MNIIFKAITGSQSYGTSIATSDIDYKGVYMQSIDDLITFNYKEQIEASKDECYYEVKRFLQLLQSANPTVLELLYSPKDCIIVDSPYFDLIVENKEKFLTKKCMMSFGGYAVEQIKKAKGLNKKMNFEKDRVKRKTPIDFIYIETNGKTMPIKKWLQLKNFSQEKCGLSKLNHFRDCYALYYNDLKSFKGLISEKSNDVKLSSIPKGLQSEGVVYFNKDGYSMHCKEFNEYQVWIKNRNEQRFVDVKSHGQKIDGKNMLHCRRLIDMAFEIATDKKITVKRPNAEYLLSIRKGEVDLNTLIDEAEKDIKSLDELFKKSDLPNECDKKFVNDLLLKIRKL